MSGSGNVAQFTIQKLIELGARPVSFSDSSGCLYDEQGVTVDKLQRLMQIKNINRGRVRDYVETYPDAVYTPFDPSVPYNPLWTYPADCAFPSATQNEINEQDARHLIDNGVTLVCEGANMPTTPEGVDIFLEHKILYGPGKAANAGGVSVSGLEMAQNSMRLNWPRAEVDARLQEIMKRIHRMCADTADQYGMAGNYLAGANIAGFVKVVNAMIDQGVV